MPIVPADRSDLDAIVALLEAVDLPFDDLTDASLQHFRVLRRQKAVCGVVGLEPVGSAALLRSLAIEPSKRGEGYGQALVREAEAYGRAQGVDALYLLTTTAAPFFAALGYAPIDRNAVPAPIAQTDEFTRICPNTATCMQKSLIS